MDVRQQFKDDVRAILEEELVAPVLGPALALAKAQAADLVAVTTELDALRALLTGAVPLLELAAELVARLRCHNCPVRSRCPRFDSTTTTTASDWPCTTIPAKLRELAQGLRVAMGEEEEG